MGETRTNDLFEEGGENEVQGISDPSVNAEMIDKSKAETFIVMPVDELERLFTIGRKVHSRRFREYCDNSVTPELNDAVTAILKDIVRFHDAQFSRNPVKANAHRRHVTGLKEVKKQLLMKKLKMVVVAPDLEKNQIKGGLDNQIVDLRQICSSQGIPCVFALHRRLLGKLLCKPVPVSCVGIINYEGTEANFKVMIEALSKAREHYKALIKPSDSEEVVGHEGEAAVASDVNKQVVASLLAKLCEKETVSEDPFLQAIIDHIM